MILPINKQQLSPARLIYAVFGPKYYIQGEIRSKPSAFTLLTPLFPGFSISFTETTWGFLLYLECWTTNGKTQVPMPAQPSSLGNLGDVTVTQPKLPHRAIHG